MRDSIAKIFKPESSEHSGTAWLVSDSHVLTAFHCIEDVTGYPYPPDMRYRLLFESGLEVYATVAAHHRNVDVALLKIDNYSFPTKGRVIFGKLPTGEDWVRYRAFQKPSWESYGYPVGHDLGLAVEGVINDTQAVVSGRLDGTEPAIQLTCEQGGLGYLNGLSGSAVVHNGSVVGIIRSGPVDYKSKIIHAVPMERVAEVLEPMYEIIKQSFAYSIKVVAPNLLGPAEEVANSTSEEDRRSSKTKTNLPRRRLSAYGRDEEVHEITNKISQEKAHFVTLTGPNGLGKKTLALAVGNEFLNVLDGVFIADLFPVGPDRALIEIGNRLGVKEAHDSLLEENIIVEVGKKKTLLIIFSANHLAGLEENFNRLLKHCSNLYILAVSTTNLGWASELNYPVQPLSLIGVQPKTPIEVLAGFPPVRLFIDQAKMVNPLFNLDNSNAPFVVRLILLAGGTPLSLSMVAAMSSEILSDIAENFSEVARMQENLEKISTNSESEKHRNIITSVFSSLDQESQSLLCRLSVFKGGCSLETAVEIDKTHLRTQLSTKKKLDILQKRNLIFSYTKEGQYRRFSMPTDVRDYCTFLLSKSGEIYAASREHADYYSRMVNHFERRITLVGGSDIPKSLELLEIEYNNIIDAFHWLRNCLDDKEKEELALGIVGNLFWFWNLRGSLDEGRKIVERMLIKSWQDTEMLGSALYCVGGLSFLQGDFLAARKFLTRSIAVLEKIGNDRRLAYGLVILGMVALHNDQGDEALWHEQRAVDLFEQTDNSVGLALATNDLANVFLEKQNINEAERLYLLSYKLWKDLNNKWGMGLATSNLGHLNCRKGNYELAEQWLIEAMAIQQSGHYQWGYAESTKRMGYVALAKKDYCSAASLFYDSLVLHQRIGRTQLVADCMDGLAEVAIKLKNASEAGVLLGAAEKIREKIGASLPVVPQKMHDEALKAASDISADINKSPAVFKVYLTEGENLGLLKAVDRAAEFARSVISRRHIS